MKKTVGTRNPELILKILFDLGTLQHHSSQDIRYSVLRLMQGFAYQRYEFLCGIFQSLHGWLT